ncbi:hypothetical protein RRG08_013135 [Elysia crispata]|uniref:Uncharacterized protein n=1 Tax=Elysia crispata TaxID=231223 RepID=A0AAE1A1Q8_9GAST|nr:hypothetical protein RRG08_013135 [Elysia crispata]
MRVTGRYRLQVQPQDYTACSPIASPKYCSGNEALNYHAIILEYPNFLFRFKISTQSMRMRLRVSLAITAISCLTLPAKDIFINPNRLI